MSLLAPYVPLIRPPNPPTSDAFFDGNPEGNLVGWQGREVFDRNTRTFYYFEGESGSTTGWIVKLVLPE